MSQKRKIYFAVPNKMVVLFYSAIKDLLCLTVFFLCVWKFSRCIKIGVISRKTCCETLKGIMWDDNYISCVRGCGVLWLRFGCSTHNPDARP